MGDSVTGLNLFNTQKLVNLFAGFDKESFEQKVKDTTFLAQNTESIFSHNEMSFSFAENDFLTKNLEKVFLEKAYQSVKSDIRHLKARDSFIDDSLTAKNIGIKDHEAALRATDPDIVKIENKISENQKQINDYQKGITTSKTNKSFYESSLNTSSLLKSQLSQFKGLEMSLIGQISSIKSQINDIKSGKFSVSAIQSKITGSSSTLAIDTASLIQTDAGAGALIGAQNSSVSKEIQSISEGSKESLQSDANQQAIEGQIKDSLLAMLEELLGKKEQEYDDTRQKIEAKIQELDKNEEIVQKYKQDLDSGEKDRTNIEEKIKKLIDENKELVQQRLKKDPEFVKFKSVENFFKNCLMGNGETGAGIGAEVSRKSDIVEELKKEFLDKTYVSDDLEKTKDLKLFLKNESKSCFEVSKAISEREKQMFEIFKSQYGK